jgi:hypothetical protein
MSMVKMCNKCNLEKDIILFQTIKNNKDGLSYSCKACLKEYTSSYYNKNKETLKYKNREYVKNNKENIDKYKKDWYLENKEDILDKSKKFYYDNKDSKIEYQMNYWLKNKDNIRIRNSNYVKQRRKNDITYKLSCNIKTSIYNSIKCLGYKKESKTFDILGCSFEEFKLYMESKFETWMSWDNHGLYNGELNYGWDIDHITPISSAASQQEILKLNHYTNLQPLCSYTNRYIKKDNLIYENL